MDTNHVRRCLHLTNIDKRNELELNRAKVTSIEDTIDKVPNQKRRLLQAMIQMQKEKNTFQEKSDGMEA
jgi:predicted  nucleic acid-binding Zn-ribbon protein